MIAESTSGAPPPVLLGCTTVHVVRTPKCFTDVVRRRRMALPLRVAASRTALTFAAVVAAGKVVGWISARPGALQRARARALRQRRRFHARSLPEPEPVPTGSRDVRLSAQQCAGLRLACHNGRAMLVENVLRAGRAGEVMLAAGEEIRGIGAPFGQEGALRAEPSFGEVLYVLRTCAGAGCGAVLRTGPLGGRASHANASSGDDKDDPWWREFAAHVPLMEKASEHWGEFECWLDESELAVLPAETAAQKPEEGGGDIFVPAGAFLPFERSALESALEAKLQSPRERRELSACQEALRRILSVEFAEARETLKEMCTGSERQIYTNTRATSSLKRVPDSRYSTEDVQARKNEEGFLRGFLQLAAQARYAPVSAEDLDLAEQLESTSGDMISLPVRVRWEAMESEWLTRFFELPCNAANVDDGGADPRLRAFFDKAVVLQRGHACLQREGLMFVPKLDLLQTVWFSRIFKPVGETVQRLGQLLWDKATGMASDRPYLSSSVDWLVNGAPFAQRLELLRAITGKKSPGGAQSFSASNADAAALVVEDGKMRRLERRTLMEDWSAQPLRSLLRDSALKEPAFGSLVVLYRRAASDRATNPLQLRMYRDTPMASIKMALPEKELLVRPLDLLRLDLTTLAGALYLVFVSFFQDGFDPWLTLPALFVFVTRTALYYSNTQQRYQSETSEMLLESTEASGGSVLLHLAYSAEAQVFKEVSLAFFFAYQLRATAGVGAAEASAFAEFFVQDELGHQCALDLQEAFDRLLDLGLVQRETRADGPPLYHAVDLGKAAEKLRKRWDALGPPLR